MHLRQLYLGKIFGVKLDDIKFEAHTKQDYKQVFSWRILNMKYRNLHCS